MSISRRGFLKASAVVSAPLILPGRVWAQGANKKMTIGFIGTGKQSEHLMNQFLQWEDIQVMGVCDVDTTRREWAKNKVNEYYTKNPAKGKPECKGFNDYRELLADKSVDMVCIATPDHWHAIQTVDALKAGKDVYCEKPLTHNIMEAVAIMAAVEKYGRVLQTGSMQRSSREFLTAAELVANGVIGKIDRVVCNFGDAAVPCELAEEAMEPGLDWDKWLGPAPARAYNSTLSPRGVHKHFPAWRRYKEYATGAVGDWGAHHMDIAQWALQKDKTSPVLITPPADEKAKRGVVLTYACGVKIEHNTDALGAGAHFYGSNGEVLVNRGKFALKMGDKFFSKFMDKEVDKEMSCERAYMLARKEFLKDQKIKLYDLNKGGHIRDFIDCVIARRKPIANEFAGAHSAILCHMVSQSYYHRQKMEWNPVKSCFAGGTGDPAWITREYRGNYKFPTV